MSGVPLATTARWQKKNSLPEPGTSTQYRVLRTVLNYNIIVEQNGIFFRRGLS
jgi:hypothetical protein